jgi:hypothetical protein
MAVPVKKPNAESVEIGGAADTGGGAGLAALGGDGVDLHLVAGGGIVSVDDDIGAVPPELLGYRVADAGGSARDHCEQPSEISLSVHVLPLQLSRPVGAAMAVAVTLPAGRRR